MKKRNQKILILIIALLAAGVIKSPWEEKAQKDFIAQGLLSEPLELSTREKIGQTCGAVALGGLRSVVATFINLAAYGSFENRDWVRLEEQFQLIVSLQPKTSYYWDVGAWHLAYNAAVDYKEREELPAPRQEALHRSYVFKGRAFLERGVRNNPNDWTLLSSLGRFYGTASKYPDYEKSAAAYQRAWETKKARNYEARAWLYSLARVPNQGKASLALARELFAKESNRVDTLRCLLFVLEWRNGEKVNTYELLQKLFPSDEEARRMLETYQQNNAEQLPVVGVDHALQVLADRMK